MTHAPTGLTASDGKYLHIGDTVQLVLDAGVGTNADRWYGWIEASDDTHVFVRPDCWYDVHGVRHEMGSHVVKVHPLLLRSLAFH